MKLSLLTGAVALAMTTAAIANEPASTSTTMDPAATFKSLDTDGNGRISESEARAHDALNAGYRDAVSDTAQGMTMEEFNAWHANQKPSGTPPSN